MANNIKAGFKATEIMPLDRHEVLKRLPRSLKDAEDENTSSNARIIAHLGTLRPNPSTAVPRGKKLQTIQARTSVKTSNLEAETMNN